MGVVREVAEMEHVERELLLLPRGADHPLGEGRREEVGKDGQDRDPHDQSSSSPGGSATTMRRAARSTRFRNSGTAGTISSRSPRTT